MSTEFINLSEIYLPTAGGTIDGDVEVGGAITVNDGSGAGTNYDVAYEISQLKAENEELKAAWDSVSRAHEDTGWQNLYVANNIEIVYRKKNGFVTVNGTSAGYYDIGGSKFYEISTLPSGCRPSRSIEFTMHFQGGGALNHSCYIGSDGIIKMWCASSSCSYWSFSVTFPTD